MKAIQCLWHGVDTAKIGYMVRWPDTMIQKFQQYAALREEAQKADRAGQIATEYLGLPDQPFAVRPMGARMYPYAFERCGIVIFIASVLEPWTRDGVETPNVRAEFQPYAVATRGLEHCHQYILGLIAAMGGKCTGDKLSEIHVTSDMETDRPPRASDYHVSLDQPWKKVRTRIRTNGSADETETSPGLDARLETDGTHLKYVHIGKDKKMTRIYDKLAEIAKHPEKQFVEFLWSRKLHLNPIGDNWLQVRRPQAVTRVEFQLRRERLLELGINTVAEFQTRRRTLWQHLTHEFVTLIEDDDSNRSRCSTQEWWRAAQASWDDDDGVGLTAPLPVMPSTKKLADMLMGVLTSFGACKAQDVTDSLEAIVYLAHEEWAESHSESWQEIVQHKREKLNIKFGVPADWSSGDALNTD